MYHQRKNNDWERVGKKYDTLSFSNRSDFLWETADYVNLKIQKKLIYHLKYGWMPLSKPFCRLLKSIVKKLYS